MKDEFIISKVIETGSEHHETVSYQIYKPKSDDEINLSREELVRLSLFLNEYVKRRWIMKIILLPINLV